MSKPFKEPYIQCCPQCGWISEVLITGDLLFAVNCAVCESSLKLTYKIETYPVSRAIYPLLPLTEFSVLPYLAVKLRLKFVLICGDCKNN